MAGHFTRPLKIRPIGCPEMSVADYHSTGVTFQTSHDLIYTAAEA
jgi:hypothetical protein